MKAVEQEQCYSVFTFRACYSRIESIAKWSWSMHLNGQTNWRNDGHLTENWKIFAEFSYTVSINAIYIFQKWNIWGVWKAYAENGIAKKELRHIIFFIKSILNIQHITLDLGLRILWRAFQPIHYSLEVYFCFILDRLFSIQFAEWRIRCGIEIMVHPLNWLYVMQSSNDTLQSPTDFFIDCSILCGPSLALPRVNFGCIFSPDPAYISHNIWLYVHNIGAHSTHTHTTYKFASIMKAFCFCVCLLVFY